MRAACLALVAALAAVAIAQPIPWPVAYHDYERTAASPFTGPHGKWHDHAAYWRGDLGGTAFSLLISQNGTSVVGVSLDGNTEASSSSVVSSSSSSSSSGFFLLNTGSSFASFSSFTGSSGGTSSGGSSGGSSDSSSGDSDSDTSDSDALLKRGRRHHARQSSQYGENVYFVDSYGSEIWIDQSLSGTSFAYALSANDSRLYQVTFNAYNASFAPVVSCALIAGGSVWVNQVSGLFASLAVPIMAHADFFPASNVVLITGYSAGANVFAAVDASTGALLWQNTSFFFAVQTSADFNFAVTDGEGKAFTAQFSASGLLVSAWDIDLRTGDYSPKWQKTTAVTTTGPIGPVVYGSTEGVLYVQFSASTSYAYLWALASSDGSTLYSTDFSSGIVGLTLSPDAYMWIMFANGTLSHVTRSPQLVPDFVANLCKPSTPMQSPMSDAEGSAYVVCNHHVVGVSANKTLRFMADVRGGHWAPGLTPVLGGDDLLIAATEAHLWSWSGSPPHHKKSSSFKWWYWVIIGVAGGTFILFVAVRILLICCNRRRSYTYIN